MANQNQSVRACILKVDIKCCTGCQNKAKTKLQSLSGVSAVDYNQEKGLMTVTGDVEPMTLVQKLIRCGKKAELVSVKYQLDDDDDDVMTDEEEEDTASDTSSYRDLKTQEDKENLNEKSKKSKKTKCIALGCLWKKSKPKTVQSLKMLNSHWHVPSKFENGFGPGFLFGNANPYAPMMQPQGYPQMMQPQQVPMTGPAMPHNANNTLPRQPPPYYQTVNPTLHYPRK